MPMRKLLLTVVLTIVTAAALRSYHVHAQQGVNFTFASIDVPVPNATETKAWSINARGDIVGRYFVNGVGPHGFLRYANGTFATIDIPGVNGTVLRGNNAKGDAVGRYFDFSGG